MKIILNTILSLNLLLIGYQAQAVSLDTTSAENIDNKYTLAIIKKIDKDNQKITLKHETIKNLGMPGMTMIFKLKLKDINLIDTLNVGDNVSVYFDKTNEGFVVKEVIKK